MKKKSDLDKGQDLMMDFYSGSFNNPYESAILKLKEIPKLKSPVHKLKAITKTVELIHSSI